MVSSKHPVPTVIFFNLNLNVFPLFKEDFSASTNLNPDRIYDTSLLVNKVLKSVKLINYKSANHKSICLFKSFKDKLVFHLTKRLSAVLLDEKTPETNISLKHSATAWPFSLSIHDIFTNITKLRRLSNVSIIFNVKSNPGAWKRCKLAKGAMVKLEDQTHISE